MSEVLTVEAVRELTVLASRVDPALTDVDRVDLPRAVDTSHSVAASGAGMPEDAYVSRRSAAGRDPFVDKQTRGKFLSTGGLMAPGIVGPGF